MQAPCLHSTIFDDVESKAEKIPVESLLVLQGELVCRKVAVLKDDGCNTNVISKDFATRNAHLFDIRDCDIPVSHSKKDTTEVATQIILQGKLRIGGHVYVSNWAVADCRYDVLLGMPWHVEVQPEVDYSGPNVVVQGEVLPKLPQQDCGHNIKVTNLGVKKFRSLLRKKAGCNSFRVYQLVETNNLFMSEEVKKYDGSKRLEGLLSKFSTVFRDELPTGLPPKRAIDHAIELEEGARPPNRTLFQLSPAELVAVKEYVLELLKKGKIRRSKSPFGASLFLVREKDKMRAVVDYRGLNRITKRNSTPLPRCDEMFDRLGEARYFSKMDLKTGFHQIRVRPEDIEKTAFKTKYGQFEYLVLPMGLCNAPATFQTLMNTIFQDCIDVYLVVYMDDLLVFSKTEDDHMRHLETVLSRLQSEELFVASKKCSFMQLETEFLGLIVGKNGIKVNPEKAEVIRTWPKPKSLSELRSFIGLLQFFRRFMKGFSARASPLTSLTKKGMGMDKWGDTCEAAFEDLKGALLTAPILIPPNWSKPFRCHVDASNKAIGGTLTQLDTEGGERVIAYYSRKLSHAEEKCTTNEKELLGLVYCLKRFRCYLEGTTFEIFTDNQILNSFLTKPKLSGKEARWLELFGQFGISKMSLRPGRVHVLGDVLSRAPHVMSGILQVGNMELSKAKIDLGFEKFYFEDQLWGPIFKALTGEKIKKTVDRHRASLLLPSFIIKEGLLYYRDRICVPRKCVRELLQLVHDCKVAGHFGFAKTLARLSGYHWRHKSRDVKRYCDGCVVCQQNKDGNQKRFNSPQPLESPTRRWGSVSTDFIVQLPPTNGFDAITTWVDRFSRRVHFIPCRTEDTAVECAKAFFDNIFKLHGLPDDIVSDRDPKFTSAFWRELLTLCGVTGKMSTSHHPQTDGQSEVMNRMVENFLRCYCALNQRNWDTLLPAAEFAYNSSLSEDLGMTPFEVDLGWQPKSAVNLLQAKESSNESINQFKERMAEAFRDARFSHEVAKARQSAYSANKTQAHPYKKGDLVWLDKVLFKDDVARVQDSNKLAAKRFGPFKILGLIGKNAVRLQLPENTRIHSVVHAEHTRPYRIQPEEIATESEPRPTPVVCEDGGVEYVVGEILAHRLRGKKFKFLTLMKGAPRHEATWQPTDDFVDDDGKITEVFLEYITRKDILRHLH